MKHLPLRRLLPLGLLLCPSWLVAQSAPGMDFELRVNLEDRQALNAKATLPDKSSQRVELESGIAVELRATALASGGQWIEARLFDKTAGESRQLALMDWPFRLDPPWSPQILAFSRCGDRVIAVRDAAPGRCADLPPMAKPDRLLGDCGAAGFRCLGPYESLPRKLTAQGRIAPRSEPGESLRVTGRVLDAAGHPRAGVIVYGYQTDRSGEYPPVTPPRSHLSNYHGRLRGWVRSDANGRYTLDTILPGSYGGNPAHIHMHVIEPGCGTYYIDDLMFAGDPQLEALTPAQRANMLRNLGGSGVTHLVRKGRGWIATRDILLGEHVEGHDTCAPSSEPLRR